VDRLFRQFAGREPVQGELRLALLQLGQVEQIVQGAQQPVGVLARGRDQVRFASR
jgi:hypothetical protein